MDARCKKNRHPIILIEFSYVNLLKQDRSTLFDYWLKLIETLMSALRV
ncbi:hypothetical protein [Methylomonas albis]|nr:hypothetical protein [Methylomonas albis]